MFFLSIRSRAQKYLALGSSEKYLFAKTIFLGQDYSGQYLGLSETILRCRYKPL